MSHLITVTEYNMTFDEAVRFFGSQNKLAGALGVDRAAVSVWKSRGEGGVPLLAQYRLARISGGALQVEDPHCDAMVFRRALGIV